jgi:hypothetical protein
MAGGTGIAAPTSTLVGLSDSKRTIGVVRDELHDAQIRQQLVQHSERQLHLRFASINGFSESACLVSRSMS